MRRSYSRYRLLLLGPAAIIHQYTKAPRHLSIGGTEFIDEKDDLYRLRRRGVDARRIDPALELRVEVAHGDFDFVADRSAG